MADWLTTPASATLSRLLVVVVYTAMALATGWAACRLRRGDAMRALLVWLAVSAAVWAVWFASLIVTGTALSHWTAHGFRLLLVVTWPPLAVGWLRWAQRWTTELRKVTDQ